MRINKLLGALGNIKQISEGIKNNIFKTEDVEAVAKLRWMECKVCPLLDEKGSSCAMPGSQPCCSDCGCAMKFKLRALSSSCPKGRWKAVMTKEQEKDLNDQLFFGHKAQAEHKEKIKKLKAYEKLKYEKAKAKRDGGNI